MKKKIDTTILSAVEIYKHILDGNLVRFPQCFWDSIDNNELRELIIYFLEKVVQIQDNLIPSLTYYDFKKYKLGTVIEKIFDYSVFKAVDFVYPGKYKIWEFNVPKNYWNHETAAVATTWLIEEHLNWSETDVKHKLDTSTFQDSCLNGVFSNLFNSSPFLMLDNAYPQKYKIWQLEKCTPANYWIDTHIREAVSWLIEERLRWTDEDFREKFTGDILINYGLGGILAAIGTVFGVIEITYPGKFQPNDFKCVGRNYWNEDNIRHELAGFFEYRLKWNEKDFKAHYSAKLLRAHGYGSLLLKFDNSPFKLLDFVYPNRFKIWEFQRVPDKYWDDDANVHNALHWLFSEYKGSAITKKVFAQNGLGGLLILKFNNSVNAAVKKYNTFIFVRMK